MSVLLFLLALAQTAAPADPVSVEARFLSRGDLPNDIDFPLLPLGFAVVSVRLENTTEAAWTVAPDEIQVHDRKGKELPPALLEEITPKVMKHGRTNKRFAGGGAEIGTRYPGPYPPGQYPGGRSSTHPGVYQPPVPGGSGPGTVAVGEAQRVRGILESHQLQPVTLQPGETLEALIYLKSKQPASKLSGGTLRIASLNPVVVR